MARPRSDIRERVLVSAAARFEQDGVEGTSLREVARNAQTSIGMIYYYFPTKDDLFLAVVEDVYVALLHDLEGTLSAEQSYEERIRSLYLRLGALTEKEGRVVRLVVREALASSQRFERVIERFKRGHIPLVLSFVMTAQKEQVFRADLHPFVALASLLSVGSLSQAVLGVLGRSFPMPPSQVIAEQLLSVVWRGLTQSATQTDTVARRTR